MTKLALHEALKSIVWTQFDFDEKIVVHRVEARHGSGAAPPFYSHIRPLVGVSHACSWSHLLVLGAILWAFIAER